MPTLDQLRVTFICFYMKSHHSSCIFYIYSNFCWIFNKNKYHKNFFFLNVKRKLSPIIIYEIKVIDIYIYMLNPHSAYQKPLILPIYTYLNPSICLKCPHSAYNHSFCLQPLILPWSIYKMSTSVFSVLGKHFLSKLYIFIFVLLQYAYGTQHA